MRWSHDSRRVTTLIVTLSSSTTRHMDRNEPCARREARGGTPQNHSHKRTRKLYTVRFVPCVALIMGVGFLLESRNEKCHSKNMQKAWRLAMSSMHETKMNSNSGPKIGSGNMKKLVAWPSQVYTRTKLNVKRKMKNEKTCRLAKSRHTS